MTCDNFVISPDGRKGIGVVQPQSGLDYPFVAPSEDVQHLFADFYLAYDDPGFYAGHNAPPAIQHPLRVEWLYGIGCAGSESSESEATPTHSADLRIVDANDVVVFDSTQAQTFDRHDWGTDYEIIEWIQRADTAADRHVVCRAVIYLTWPSSMTPKHFPLTIYPDNAVLDERAVEKLPKRVRSVKVRVGNTVLGVPAKESGLRFQAGYNMRLAAGTPAVVGARRNTDISFIAAAGDGFGQYDDCDDTPCNSPIIQINGATPTANGDFLISAKDCLYAREPTNMIEAQTGVTPRTFNGCTYLEIGSNCPPCCDCVDYVNTALYMNRTRNRYKTVGSRTHQIKLLHESNIERWIESRDCRLSKPLKLVLVPQCCPQMDVVMLYCNQTQQCQEHVRLTVNFSTFPPGAIGTLRCGYSQLYAPEIPGERYGVNGTWPTFWADLPPVDIGNSSYIKFRLVFAPKTFPYAVTGTLTATTDSSQVAPLLLPVAPFTPAEATTTNVLNCNLQGEDTGC